MAGSVLHPPNTLTPPPGAGFHGRLRRIWRSRKALSGVTQWVIDWGIPFAVVVALIWIFAARSGSAGGVYKVFTLMDPPEHILLWFASLIGWLLVPAIIGGVAGHVIAARIKSVKAIPANQMFKRRKLGQRLRPPAAIDDLASYFHGTAAQQHFVDAFVRLAHRNNWSKAQDHWEVVIGITMSTPQHSELNRHESLRQAQDTSLQHLLVAALVGGCRVCESQ
ncbi:DUF6313 family protein [Streptomyces sp. R-74717]|uniref:DUF6313 family protein n=1 Tax=Streptomyces TaxID=1883 RepID=UPI00224E5D3C|nr:DUF6313 family protein [Streptomyces atratus]MCX5343354.1 DUF6313 family protein [Streptomyces atratus]